MRHENPFQMMRVTPPQRVRTFCLIRCLVETSDASVNSWLLGARSDKSPYLSVTAQMLPWMLVT
jgi:hypothetical protein